MVTLWGSALRFARFWFWERLRQAVHSPVASTVNSASGSSRSVRGAQ